MMDKGTINPAQCRAARAMLEWSQEKLADKAELSRLMIAQFEQGKKKRPLKMSLVAIETALMNAGIVLIKDEDGTVFVGLKVEESAQ
jgi:transcriptional regulator with XRE-family HTH domain